MAERIRHGLCEPVAVEGAHAGRHRQHRRGRDVRGECTAATLLRDADNAMYEAKRGGRDQIVALPHQCAEAANLKWGLSATRDAQLSTG